MTRESVVSTCNDGWEHVSIIHCIPFSLVIHLGRFALDILNVQVDKGASGPGVREYTRNHRTRKEGSCILVKIRYIYIGQ